MRRWVRIGMKGYVVPTGIRQDVVQRCVDARWAVALPVRDMRSTAAMELTDLGCVALAAAR